MAYPSYPYNVNPFTGKFSPLNQVSSPYQALSAPVSPYMALTAPGSSQPGTHEPNLLGLIAALKQEMPSMNVAGRIPPPAPQPEMQQSGLLGQMLNRAMNTMPPPYTDSDQTGSDSPGLLRRLLNWFNSQPVNPEMGNTIASNAYSPQAAYGPYGTGF